MIKVLRSRWYYGPVLILCVGLLLPVAVRIVNGVDYIHSDFSTFWLAGRMVWTGQNPYSADDWVSGHHQFGATWIANPRFLYPLPLAFFYSPLGLLSLYHAQVTYVFLVEAVIFFSVLALILLQKEPARKYYIVPALAGVVLFRPTIITLLNGQISGLLLLVLTCVVLLWEKERWLLGGALLSLAALKPSLGGPLLIVLSLWLLAQKRASAFAGMAVSGSALALAGMMLDANWIAEYVEIGNSKVAETFGFSPTLWGLSAYVTGFRLLPTLVLGGLAIALVAPGACYLMWRSRRSISPAWAVSMAITTALLVTPYTWPYDQLLLVIPIITIMMEMMARKYPFLLASTAFLFLDIVAFILLALSGQIQMEVLNGLVPLAILAGLCGVRARRS